MTLEEFKAKHADNLDYLIDPDHPDLGPKNNQFCFNWGRLKAGRGESDQALLRQACGTVNTHGHTTVCQGSLYFTCKAMSDQFVEGKFTGGSKFYWQADLGTPSSSSSWGPTPSRPTTARPTRAEGHRGHRRRPAEDRRGRPALLQDCARAWKWLPVSPAADGGPCHGHDPLDHREQALRRPLSGQRQQGGGQGRQGAHLDQGRLAGQDRQGRQSRAIPARLRHRPARERSGRSKDGEGDLGVRIRSWS